MAFLLFSFSLPAVILLKLLLLPLMEVLQSSSVLFFTCRFLHCSLLINNPHSKASSTAPII